MNVKSPNFYVVIACLVAAYFSSWFIVPACVIWLAPILENIFTKENKDHKLLLNRIQNLERTLNQNGIK